MGGDEFDKGEATDPETAAEAWRRGLGLLVRREQSRRGLERKLEQRGISGEAASEAVERLSAAGWQDDERFGSAFARDRAASGYGPLRIRAELAGHGLEPAQIAAALESCEVEWAEQAAALALRRFRADVLADPARRRKAQEFLLRRGFEACQVAAALAALREGAGDG